MQDNTTDSSERRQNLKRLHDLLFLQGIPWESAKRLLDQSTWTVLTLTEYVSYAKRLPRNPKDAKDLHKEHLRQQRENARRFNKILKHLTLLCDDYHRNYMYYANGLKIKPLLDRMYQEISSILDENPHMDKGNQGI